MHWKRALYSYAVGQLANRVRLGDARASDFCDVALKHLNALFAAFNNAYVHFHLIARTHLWNVGALELIVDDVGGLHGNVLFR